MSVSPYATIVYVTDTIQGIRYQASGVLLANDEVLTASHVVYNSIWGTATNISVTPDYSRGSAPNGASTVSYFHYNHVDDALGFISGASSQNDYAILHLTHPFNVGTMGLQAGYTGGPVTVSGYPAYASGSQINTSEDVTQDPTYTLLDGTPIGAGSSGGPVWINESGNPASPAPAVVGIVSSESVTTGYSVQITTGAFNQIEAWIAQDDYSNPLLDVAFYKLNNPDVAKAPINPAYHYEVAGWREGRDPNAYFSDVGYLRVNQDVSNADDNPLDHYEATGWREGRDPGPKFSTRLYLLHNPDVARAGDDPLQHYLQFGQMEGRAIYAVISKSNTLILDFDPSFYLLSNPDVARSGLDPLTHYLATGWKEGRNPDAFFDDAGYLRANPDVARAGINPLLHYELYGWHEGRNPSTLFDTNNYEQANKDVAAAKIDPLMHYLYAGAFELRAPLGDGKFY